MSILKSIKRSLGSNSSRIFYDFGSSLLLAAFVYVFWNHLLDFSSSPNALSPLVFLLAPLILAFNGLFGIYTRFRIGSGKVKAPLLSLSLLCSCLVLGTLGVKPTALLLLGTMSWAPLVLPRVFLNFDTRSKSGLISTAIKGKGPVLVVGGAGYIGSYVLECLLSEGMPVRLFDSFLYGKDSIAEFLNHPRLEIVEGDITDIMKLTEAMNGASAVVHLAGLVGDPACAVDESFTRHTNVIATRMLKEVAISMGVPRFIFASSCSVYGANDNEVDENSELNPVSLYARTKIDSERELLSLIDESFCVTILRFATVFGHSRRPRFDLVANLFTAQAVNENQITVMGENQWRPFIHVKDLARAVVMALKAKPDVVRSQTFNVGDSRLNMTIGSLAKEVQAIVGADRNVDLSIQPNIGDRRNYIVSFKKINKALGFEASVLMKDGISEMYSEFKKGSYNHYRDAIYSNLEMTRKAVVDFKDPDRKSVV